MLFFTPCRWKEFRKKQHDWALSQQWSLHQLLVSVIPRGFWESLVSLCQWPSNLFGCDCTKECIVLSRRVLPDMTGWNKNTQASYGWEMQIIPFCFLSFYYYCFFDAGWWRRIRLRRLGTSERHEVNREPTTTVHKGKGYFKAILLKAQIKTSWNQDCWEKYQ